MILRVIFYTILFYIIFLVIRFFIRINDVLKNQNQKRDADKEKKAYTKDEIQDAEYEEIK